MARKGYSETYKAECLIVLAMNRYDYDKTALETGVSAGSLRNWDKTFPKHTVPALLERAIERMLMLIPDKFEGKDWSVSLGILIDKWLLWKGMPTARMENILKNVAGLREDEYADVLEEAERIIAEADRGSSDFSDS